MDIQAINQPQDLLGKDTEQDTYAFENFIKVGTRGERSRSKRKLKLLKVVDAEIQNIVDEDETVFFVTDGVLVKTVEQLFLGWVAYYYNLTAFVFTTKRVLLIHIKNRTTRGVFLRSIEYADMREVKGSALSGFRIRLRNGKTLTFSRVPGADRKELVTFLNGVLDVNAPKDKQAIGMRNLCPDCLTDYGEVLVTKCEHCGLTFKSARKAALASLLMPGLGDIYLGSKVLGAMELVFMGFIWLSILMGLVADLSAGISIVASVFTIIVVWLLIHPIDAVKAYYMGSKGLIPVNAPATYGTVEPGILDSPVTPLKANRSKARFLILIPLAGIFLIILFSIVLEVMDETGMTPSGEVLHVSEIPERVIEQLIDYELIGDSSKLIYFHSDGIFSIMESGTLLSEDRLTIYMQNENYEVMVYWLPLEIIKEVVLVSEGSELQDSVYRAVGFEEDQWIQFTLPVEGEERFIAQLKSMIQTSTND